MMITYIICKFDNKKKFKMGNNFTVEGKSQSKYSHITSQQNNQLQWSQQDSQSETLWKDVTHQNIYYRLQYGKFQLYRNEVTLQQVQKYKIVLKDKGEFERWKQSTKWRNYCQFLPKVQYFVVQNMTQICVSQFQINVFVQRIPLRLADLTDIPFPQNLYFLMAVFKGLKYLFSNPFGVKMFNVTESMICVNKQGEVKVWFNTNLSQSSSIDNKENSNFNNQTITTVIDLIESNTDKRDYPYPFTRYLRQKNNHISNELDNNFNNDFNKIIQLLYSYARQMNVTIPKFAFSVRDVLNRDFLNGTQVEQTENSIKENSNLQYGEQQRIGQLSMQHQNINSQKDNQIRGNDLLKFLQKQNSIQKQPYTIQKQQSYTFHDQTFPKDKIHKLFSNNTNNNQTPFPNIPNLRVEKSQSQIERNFNFVNQSMKTDKPMIVNKFGNNIIQFRQPSVQIVRHSYIVNSNNLQNCNQRPASLNKVNSGPQQLPINSQSNKQFASVRIPQFEHQHPGPVASHSLGYLVNGNQAASVTYFNIPQIKSTHQFYPPQLQQIQTKDYSFQRINSYSIPMRQHKKESEFINYIRDPVSEIRQPVRPQLLSSQVKIERINRQNSSTVQQLRKDEVKYSGSFKNNLVKLQHQEPSKEDQAGRLRYFTRKDSQETLDPQIALDLMKYLNE